MPIKAPDIAIDLGTTNTLVYVYHKGIVISEPTIVVVESRDKHLVRAVGDEAALLLGRTTEALQAILPIRDGTIQDFDTAEVLIRYFMRKAIGVSHLLKPRVLVCIPAGLPAVARKVVTEAVSMAGGKHIVLVEKPLAAAIGAGLPVYEPVGNMVVDVGGGTTDAAIVSMGGLVVSQSIHVGGEKMNDAVVNYLKKNSGMLIGDRTAEAVKIDLASAIAPEGDSRRTHVRGRDLLSARVMDVEFTAAQAHDAVLEPCMAILACVRWVLERTPPELSADIMRNGIHLTGGAAQLYGLDRLIGSQLGIPAMLAKEPQDCTILGMGYLLENPDLLNDLAHSGINENL